MAKYLCISSYIIGSPSSYMTLQLIHSEFPYIYMRKLFSFFISAIPHLICVQIFNDDVYVSLWLFLLGLNNEGNTEEENNCNVVFISMENWWEEDGGEGKGFTPPARNPFYSRRYEKTTWTVFSCIRILINHAGTSAGLTTSAGRLESTEPLPPPSLRSALGTHRGRSFSLNPAHLSSVG